MVVDELGPPVTLCASTMAMQTIATMAVYGVLLGEIQGISFGFSSADIQKIFEMRARLIPVAVLRDGNPKALAAEKIAIREAFALLEVMI